MSQEEITQASSAGWWDHNGAIISDCYSTGAVSGGSSSYSVGGLVGENYSGSISNCYSTGSVSGDTYSSYAYVGGLVGYHYTGSISNCYSTGMVSSDVYSSYVGGLVGYNDQQLLSAAAIFLSQAGRIMVTEHR